MARGTASSPPPGPADAEIAGLYRVSLADFIDARNALAARFRKAGDAEASARVKALPKPGAPSWALNQVYWHARADYDRLVAAGDQLRALQQQMLGGRAVDPREAMQERQAAVRQVVERAARFLSDAGQSPTDATRQRIAVTADAVATWGSQPQGYEPGRLDRDIDPPGFAALAALGTPSLRLVNPAKPAAAAPPTKPASPLSPRHTGDAPPARPAIVEGAAAKRAAVKAAQEAARAREAERRRLTRALHDAQRHLELRTSARERAEAARTRAATDAENIRKELAGLEEELAAARTRLDRAERALSESDAGVAKASREQTEAEETASRSRRELEQLEGD